MHTLIIFIAILNYLPICILSNQLISNTTQENYDDHLLLLLSTESSSSSSCDFITRNDVNFALKLLKLIPYDSTTNQVLSPLALKLSLLSIASASADEKQSRAIYDFIFEVDSVNDVHDSVHDSDPAKFTESQIQEQLNRSIEATTERYPNDSIEQLHSWVRRTQSQFRFDESLCESFVESQGNKTALKNCLRYVDSSEHSTDQSANRQINQRQLNHRQQIQLCQSFGIKSYENCLNITNKKYTDTDQNVLNATTFRSCIESNAWQLAHIFHTMYDEDGEKERQYGQMRKISHSFINNFIHQFLFKNGNFDGLAKKETEEAKWKQHFDWYGLRQFDTSNLTQMREWKQLKRNHLSGLLLPELATIPSSSSLPQLLNVVMIDKRLQIDLEVEKRPFYGPQFNNLSPPVDQQQIFQMETLIGNRLRNVSIEHHFDGPWNHTLLRVPFYDHRYSLVLAMPHPNATIPDLVRGLSSEQLHHYLGLLHTATQDVYYLTIPRFPIQGRAHFGPLLRSVLNVSSLTLDPSSNFSLPLDHIQQLIRVSTFGADESSVTGLNTIGYKESITYSPVIECFNRPFLYMLVGKYLELHDRQPSFEIIVTGFYNGPEQMIRV